jgi:hypothetical protein
VVDSQSDEAVVHPARDRVLLELARLRDGGQRVTLRAGSPPVVFYHDVPTAGKALGLPTSTDVVVPVPPGYPANMIDLAGLEMGSALLPRLKGGGSSQGIVMLDGKQWQLASYHPHTNGGGPPWNPMIHGFDTYYDHLLAWLACLN